MKSKTEKILTILRILAWIGLFGYAINLGAQIICFIVSYSNPVAAKDIPGVSESLWTLRQHSFQILYLCDVGHHRAFCHDPLFLVVGGYSFIQTEYQQALHIRGLSKVGENGVLVVFYLGRRRGRHSLHEMAFKNNGTAAGYHPGRE